MEIHPRIAAGLVAAFVLIAAGIGYMLFLRPQSAAPRPPDLEAQIRKHDPRYNMQPTSGAAQPGMPPGMGRMPGGAPGVPPMGMPGRPGIPGGR